MLKHGAGRFVTAELAAKHTAQRFQLRHLAQEELLSSLREKKLLLWILEASPQI